MSLNWVIETHERVPSTQDMIRELAEAGAEEGQVVQASQQIAGRGRHGRVWESEDGNLFFSLLLRPNCQAKDIGPLALIAGLSLAETLMGYLDHEQAEIVLKWPNDVLLNDKKCAGILLETELLASGRVSAAILGLGVNIKSAPEDIGAAVEEFSSRALSAEMVRDSFLQIFGAHYTHWQEKGFDDLRERWLAYAHSKDTPINVKIGEQLESGSFHDIDAQGNLRMVTDQGQMKSITAGEVYL